MARRVKELKGIVLFLGVTMSLTSGLANDGRIFDRLEQTTPKWQELVEGKGVLFCSNPAAASWLQCDARFYSFANTRFYKLEDVKKWEQLLAAPSKHHEVHIWARYSRKNFLALDQLAINYLDVTRQVNADWQKQLVATSKNARPRVPNHLNRL